MKKFLYSLICFFAFGLVLLAGIFSYSAISKASAVETTDGTHIVNFYGSDNQTVIYSVEVPVGQSLNDLENYYFNDTTLNGVTFSPTSGVFYDLIYNQFSGFNISWTSNSYANINLFGSGSSFVPANTSVNFVYPTSILPYIRQIYFYGTNNGVTKYASNYVSYSDELITIRTYYDLDTSFNYQYIGIQLLQDGGSFDFLFAGFTYSNYVGFFTSDYVNQLYVNSGGSIGSSFEWSESSTSSSRFDFSKPITKDINLYGYNFNGQIFNYDGEVTSDYGNLGNYAITDIEFFEVSGTYLYHMVYDTDLLRSEMTLFRVPYAVGLDSSTIADSIVLTSSVPTEVFNMFIYSERVASTDNGFVGALLLGDSSDAQTCYINLKPNYGKVHLYFSLLEFEPTSRTTFNLKSNSNYIYEERFYNDLSYIVDMNSNTNYSFELEPYQFEFSSSSLNYKFLDYVLNGFEFDYDYSRSFGQNSGISINFDFEYNLIDSGFIVFNSVSWLGNGNCWFQFVPADTLVNNFVNFNVVDCFFFIHRPVQRVDNTLVIYNFDYYNILYSLSGLTYQLQADGDLYNVNYIGSVPNDYFIFISNPNVINTIFDEYVHLYLKFNNNNIILDKINDNTYSCKFGFDFNFTYYVQPLVSNNGVYNYTFTKPGYVDMPFSLSPLHIPVLEMVENAMIFLVFYCPLISDILLLIHFDLFFGSLITIFDFVFGSGIGDFILSCFAFLIFWSLLKMLFPSFISSGRDSANNFIGSIVSAQEVLDTPPKQKRFKAHRFKSSLGNNRLEQIRYYHLSRFKYEGYHGKRNSPLKKSFIRFSKMKNRR